MRIKLSDHFTFGKLIRFTLPSIAMMIFTSIYGVVDGYFVSNYVGKTPFAAVNLVYPFLMMLSTVGFMLGTGGSALVAKTMGQGNKAKANRLFSLFVYTSLVLGLLISVLGFLFLPQIARWQGAEGQLLKDAVLYGRIILLSNPFFILQMEFQSFVVTAEKPGLGLGITLAAGITNMVLDVLLVAVIPMGLVGAAIATALSQVVGGLVPLIYFCLPNASLLRLGRTRFDGPALFKACTNGSSELMSNLSMSLVNMLYNVQLLQFAGEDGIAAYGVMMYVNMIFLAVFIGYSIGTAPVVSYHFGAENHPEMKSLLRKSLTLISLFSISMVGLALLLGDPLSRLFVGYDEELLALTRHGFYIFSVSFLFAGFAIFFSGFFTALNDGVTSAIISFLRTLIFQIAAVMLLPLILKVDGIWWSITVAEVMAVLTGLIFLVLKQKKYHY